jgi:type II secretion system protein C
MGRLGIRIANALLASLCLFQIAGVVTTINEDSLVPAIAAYDSREQTVPQESQTWADREPILDRNLFAAQIVAAPPEPEPEPEEELEETKLPLVLLGTLLSDVPEKSTAAISERGAGDPELLYEGDRLERHPKVAVIAIERGRVILRNGTKREELLLTEATGASTRPTPTRTSSRTSRRRTTRQTTSRTATSNPSSIAQQLKDLQIGGTDLAGAQDLFNQARITPKWTDGEMAGMEVRDIIPGSLYEKIGLADGDVIQSFNGIELDSTAAGAEVLAQFGQAENFEIVLSDGTVKTLSSEDLPELLNSAGGSSALAPSPH